MRSVEHSHRPGRPSSTRALEHEQEVVIEYQEPDEYEQCDPQPGPSRPHTNRPPGPGYYDHTSQIYIRYVDSDSDVMEVDDDGEGMEVF